MSALLLDPAMLELMRDQAEGPWSVYAAQKQGELWQRRVGLTLLQWGAPDRARADSAPERGTAMTELLFPEHQWDVAISYAGADQAFVTAVVERLEHAGLRVFYAALPEAQSYLWGKELGLELQTIYRNKAAYCLVFVSEHYVQSAYTKLEFRTALSRALEHDQYGKPIRLDDAELTGLSPSVAFLDARPGRPYAKPSRLAPVIVDALRHRGEYVHGRRLREPPAVAGPAALDHYFDATLPAMLRWAKERAVAVDGSVLFEVSGDEAGLWLLRLAPPAPGVQRIEPQQDLRTLVLPRHLSLRLTTPQMHAMLDGSFNAKRALVEGSIEIDGDLGLLMPVGALFSGREPATAAPGSPDPAPADAPAANRTPRRALSRASPGGKKPRPPSA